MMVLSYDGLIGEHVVKLQWLAVGNYTVHPVSGVHSAGISLVPAVV